MTHPKPGGDALDFQRGYTGLIGLRLVDWREGFARMEIAVEDHHLNVQGVVHGGILATLIDAAGGFAGGYSGDSGFGLPRVTLSLQVNYIASVGEGVLSCTAQRRGGGRRSYSSTAEVTSAEGGLLATGQVVYRLFTPAAGGAA